MQEVTDDTSAESALDLRGISASLHEHLREITDGAPADEIASVLGAARRAMENADGTVIVRFDNAVSVKKGETTDRVKLRAIKARDYIDGTTRALVEHTGFGESLAFAVALVDEPAALLELSLDDSRAVYFAVKILRGNWFRPKK